MALLQHHIHALAGKVLGPEWRVLRRLLEHWPAIVGDEFAEHACPTGLTLLPRPGGEETAKLFVRIPGALAPQFQMMEKTIAARINGMMGYAFIERIVFEHKIGE